jgi:hypothetical protein
MSVVSHSWILAAQPAGDGQLGVRRDHLRDRHRGHQVPAPGRHRVDQLLQGQLAGRAQDGGDVAVRQAAGDLEPSSRPTAGGGWPFSTRTRASTLALGQDDRLAKVRFLTFRPRGSFPRAGSRAASPGPAP